MLQADSYDYAFVGEGAANVVFKVSLKPKTPQRPAQENNADVFKGHLLRVPKAGTSAYPYTELQSYWETAARPLFQKGDLVNQRLVRLAGSGDLVARLNAVLEESEASRREDFRGSRVADVTVGMLVESMDKKHPDDIVLEFKPKWLAQSPNAPPSATRCRTCAREAQRRHTRRTNNSAAKSAGCCPLDYLECATDDSALSRSLRRLAPDLADADAGADADGGRLAHWLRTNTLLPRLRDLQVSHDARGPLGGADVHDDALELAMTLRDCSVFVRVPGNGGPVEARIGDLDKKNGVAKLVYWQATERQLIDGGYYEGREQPVQETNCLLGRRSG